MVRPPLTSTHALVCTPSYILHLTSYIVCLTSGLVPCLVHVVSGMHARSSKLTTYIVFVSNGVHTHLLQILHGATYSGHLSHPGTRPRVTGTASTIGGPQGENFTLHGTSGEAVPRSAPSFSGEAVPR